MKKAAEKGMTDAGLPAFVASMYGDMYRAMLSGHMSQAEPRSADTTTPTTFEEFAADVVRPAVLAKLPRFLVTFARKDGVDLAAMQRAIPAEKAHVEELTKEGVLKHLFLSADGKRAFLVLSAVSIEAVSELSKGLPLAPFVDADIVPLA